MSLPVSFEFFPPKTPEGVSKLRGVRGQAPADVAAISDTIQRVAQLVTDFPEIAELDINPLLVREQGQGAVAVDMRLILK